MRFCFFLLSMLTLFVASARGESIDHLPGLSPADHYDFQSETIGRPFQVFVRLPYGYDETTTEYPTVYVLDGDILFPMIGAYHFLLSYDEPVSEAIIVGLSYGTFDNQNGNYRGTDYTTPPVPEELLTGPNPGDPNGGAAAFQTFLSDELIPMIEGAYRADPARRIIMGQSRGGHFVLYSALTQPDLFWGHISSNPSLAPNSEFFFQEPKSGDPSQSNLFFASGSRDIPQLREDALELFDHLNSLNEKPWRLKTTTMEGETHAAGIVNVYREAMKWFFAPDTQEAE